MTNCRYVETVDGKTSAQSCRYRQETNNKTKEKNEKERKKRTQRKRKRGEGKKKEKENIKKVNIDHSVAAI